MIFGTLMLEIDSSFAFTPVYPIGGEVSSSIATSGGLTTGSTMKKSSKAKSSKMLVLDDETATGNANNVFPGITILNHRQQNELPFALPRAGAVVRGQGQKKVISKLQLVNDIVSLTSVKNAAAAATKTIRSAGRIRATTSSATTTTTTTASSKNYQKRTSKMVRPKTRTISPRKQQKIRTLQVENEVNQSRQRKSASISSTTFLSRDEERQMTHRIRSLRRAVRIRDELVQEKEEWSSYHPSAYEEDFPTEQQWSEAAGLTVLELRRVMSEGQEAYTTLVNTHVGLVTSIAKRHYYALKQATDAGGGVGTILTLQDMIQEGNLGLMKAAERFEPERGFRFSTYATYWIKQRVLRSISDTSRVIRLPAHGKFISLLWRMRTKETVIDTIFHIFVLDTHTMIPLNFFSSCNAT
jgi:DNA-directed RNA polymerase sigma subunit (sigma70/sigma32)